MANVCGVTSARRPIAVKASLLDQGEGTVAEFETSLKGIRRTLQRDPKLPVGRNLVQEVATDRRPQGDDAAPLALVSRPRSRHAATPDSGNPLGWSHLQGFRRAG